jgi:hypothetical protein
MNLKIEPPGLGGRAHQSRFCVKTGMAWVIANATGTTKVISLKIGPIPLAVNSV